MYGMPMKLPADTALRRDWHHQTRRVLSQQYEELGIGDEDLNIDELDKIKKDVLVHLRAQAQERLALRQAEQKRRWEAKAKELHMLPGDKVHVKTCQGNQEAQSKKIRV